MTDASAHELLSNFALALAEGAELGPLLNGAVGALGRLLDVDRVSLFLGEDGAAGAGPVTIRAGWARAGVPPVPSRLATLDVSLVPEAALAGRPVFGARATEMAELAGTRETLKLLGTDSILVVPVMVGGEFWGAVTVSTVARVREWTSQDVAFVESAARHLAAALRQGKLVKDLERQRDRMRIVAEMSAAVQRGRSVEEVLEAAERGLQETLGISFGGIGLLSPDGSVLEVARSFGPSGRRIAADEVEILQSLADIASLAIVQRRAVEASERTAREARDLAAKLEGRARVAEAIASATQFLNFRLNAPGLMAAFAAEVTRVLPAADGCVVYVAEEGDEALTVAAAHGSGRAAEMAYGGDRIPVAALRCAGVAWTQVRVASLEVSGLDELMAGTDAAARARVKSAVQPHDVRHLVAAPVRVGDRRLGVLEVLGCREEGFGPEDREVLAVLAEQSAIALRNARLISELRASNRLKDDFLATLSHEVRTPLTGIIGWTEVLLEGALQEPEERRALDAILSQATLLNRMIGDLIDLSRIENIGLDVRRFPVDAADVVDAALEAVTPVARKKGVGLRREVTASLPRIDGDAGRLKQVLWNLLSNAVKFSPPGTEVVVSARPDADAVLLSVTDQGAGIEPQFLPHVFERFRQEESGAGRSFGGLGLGLAIAKAIVDAHGGRIAASSAGRGKGSVFAVRLPVRGSGVFPRLVRPSP